MTKHADRKSAARAYAAEHGVSYSEARRALGYDENGSRGTGPVGYGAPSYAGPMLRTIGHAPHPITGQPTPVRVDHFGCVVDQHIWRGRLYTLVGFHQRPQATYAPTVDAGLWLFWGERLWNPAGLYPIIAPHQRVYADPRLEKEPVWDLVALPNPVTEITAEPRLAAVSPDGTEIEGIEVTITSDEDGAPDLDVWGYEITVNDWLLSLSDEEIRIARADGWTSPVLSRFVIDEAHWQSSFVQHKGRPLPTPVVLQAWAEHTDGLMESNLIHTWLEERDPDNTAAVEARMSADGTLCYPWMGEAEPEKVEAFLDAMADRTVPSHMLNHWKPTGRDTLNGAENDAEAGA